MKRIKLTLPYPPSANRYWRHGMTRTRPPKPVTYLSDEAKAYRQEVAIICRSAGINPLIGTFAYSAVVYVKMWTRDMGNCEKVTMDALRGLAFGDDQDNVESHWLKEPSDKSPRVEIEIWEVPDPRSK